MACRRKWKLYVEEVICRQISQFSDFSTNNVDTSLVFFFLFQIDTISPLSAVINDSRKQIVKTHGRAWRIIKTRCANLTAKSGKENGGEYRGIFLSVGIAINSLINNNVFSITTGKLTALCRINEQHESYQRARITASINNAISDLTSCMREPHVNTYSFYYMRSVRYVDIQYISKNW